MDLLFPGYKPTAYSVMLKPVGPVCNLNCTYCYYLEKKNLYPSSRNFRMSDEVLEEYTRQYIASQNVPVVSFVWQGGEPCLLGVDFFKKAVSYQKKHNNGKQIENIFQTNGTLLDDEFCRFFHDNNVLVGISIDGPKHLHNAWRPMARGTGSFDEVMRGINLCKQHKVEFNTLSVVNREYAYHSLEIYNFLKEIGSGFIQFIPIVERQLENASEKDLKLIAPSHGNKARVTDWSVEPLQYGKFLAEIFDEWVRKDVGRYFVQMFDVTLANWAGERPGLCVFTETCGDAMVMEHNGDLFSCDHFVYKEYFLGNIMKKPLIEMVGTEEQKKFGKDKRDLLPRYCFECEYRFACHGECPKHRFEFTPDGSTGLNYLCPAYKYFFAHVHPYMQFMVEELKAKRPPANVMQWVQRMDRQKLQSARKPEILGRNDPCPCGSGKKFKNCHWGQPGF